MPYENFGAKADDKTTDKDEGERTGALKSC